ncbi:hypothetical protein VPH35_004846 [Triticum aestivum]
MTRFFSYTPATYFFFLSIFADFEFSAVENTYKIITRIHELTFEWQKCDVQLALTRLISCLGRGDRGGNGDQEERGHPGRQGPQGEEGVPPCRSERFAGRQPEHHRRQWHPRLHAVHQFPHGEGCQGHPGQPSDLGS